MQSRPEHVNDAVQALSDEFRGFSHEVGEHARQAALAAVDRWCWTDIGAPGIGDFEADLRGGEPFPWQEARPNAADPASCGLDADGRVRVIRYASVSVEQVIEHTPERVRILSVDSPGTVGGVEDVFLAGDRYRFAVAVTDEMWAYRRYDYDDERLCSVWTVRQRAGDAAPAVIVMTPRYGRRGRLRKVDAKVDLSGESFRGSSAQAHATEPAAEVPPAEPPNDARALLIHHGASEAQADAIVAALGHHLNPEQMRRWLADPEHAHPIPDPETAETFGSVLSWTAINAIAAGRGDLVINEARRFAAGRS